MKTETNQLHPLKRHQRFGTRPKQSVTHTRRGGAAVEAAFCLPLIIILMAGTLEVCSGIYLYESCKVAAFEGIRIGIRRGGSADEVIIRAQEVLTARGIVIPADGDFGITTEPADFGQLNSLDPITCTIAVPTQGNTIFLFDTFTNRTIRASVTMVREFDN